MPSRQRRIFCVRRQDLHIRQHSDTCLHTRWLNYGRKERLGNLNRFTHRLYLPGGLRKVQCLHGHSLSRII